VGYRDVSTLGVNWILDGNKSLPWFQLPESLVCASYNGPMVSVLRYVLIPVRDYFHGFKEGAAAFTLSMFEG
jgi:hypothetical protein